MSPIPKNLDLSEILIGLFLSNMTKKITILRQALMKEFSKANL